MNENTVKKNIQRYFLENVLLGLWNCRDKYLPFQIAGTVCFAMRFCKSGAFVDRCQHVTPEALHPIIQNVTEFLTADPIGNMRQDEVNSKHPYALVLRIIGNQFIFANAIYGNFAQPFLLYEKIPIEMAIDGNTSSAKINISGALQEACGSTLFDFIVTGILAHSISIKQGMFTREYFEIARRKMNSIPDAAKILNIINGWAADPDVYKNEFEKNRVRKFGFEMYSPNPILVYPIIRPWTSKGLAVDDYKNDRFIVPLPDLIAQRISSGIYFQLLSRYGTAFTEYFGTVFERYVGKVVGKSLSNELLISENEIRVTYPTKSGKMVDWVVLDNEIAVLIECKATRVYRKTLISDDESEIHNNFKQLISGLRQLYEFKEACQNQTHGLEILNDVKIFVPLLITFDRIYQANSKMARDYIDTLLNQEGIPNFEWIILSIQEIETLQPHCSCSIRFSDIVLDIYKNDYHTVLEKLIKKTGKTYGDSFLNEINNEVINKLRPDLI